MGAIVNCNRCLEEKILGIDFYDSNIKTCKKCVIEKAKLQRELKISTPDGLEKERQRHRDKYHKLGYKDIHKPTPENKKLIQERYKNKYPEKIAVRNYTTELKPSIQGNQLHHWNYNIEYAKDIIELSEKDHNTLHRKLKYDSINLIYNAIDGEPLDTKEKHENYIKQLNIEIYNNKKQI